MASLPRFDPLQVLRNPPQRGEDPATPPHTFKGNALVRAFRFLTARKSITVARLWPEKKGCEKKAFFDGLFRVFGESELDENHSHRIENKCVKCCIYIRYVLN
jgi:hypothetical protein